MARSRVHVHVVSKDGTQRRWLQPGDEVPDWARLDGQLTEEGGQPPEETRQPTDPMPPVPPSQPPARSGRGSSVEAWRKFAEQHDVDVAADATRDDIIAACEAAGVIPAEG